MRVFIVITYIILPIFTNGQYAIEKINYDYSEKHKTYSFRELTVTKFNNNNELIEETKCRNGKYLGDVAKDTLFIKTLYYKKYTPKDSIKTYFSEDEKVWHPKTLTIDRKDTQRVINYFYDEVIWNDSLFVKGNDLVKSIWVKEYGNKYYTKRIEYFYKDNILIESLQFLDNQPFIKTKYQYIEDKKNKLNIKIENREEFEKNIWIPTYQYVSKTTIDKFPKLIEENTISIDGPFNFKIIYSYHKNFLVQIDEFESKNPYKRTCIRKLKECKSNKFIAKANQLYIEEKNSRSH